MRVAHALRAASILAAGSLAACGEAVPSDSESVFPDGVGQIHQELIRERQAAGSPRTTLTSEIDWMPSLDAAFAKATREDKPVFISTYVRESGNPENPRGSAEEAEAIRTLAPNLRDEWLEQSQLFLDGRTEQIFEAAENQNKRYPGVFEFDDPWVRRRAIELVGRYAEIEESREFLPGGEWSVFGEAVAGCLEDEDPEVRTAAAAAVYQFEGAAAPSLKGSELVAAAGQTWRQHRSTAASR